MRLQDLYGNDADSKAFASRVQSLEKFFLKQTGERPEEWFSSSGRAEICGNHTDHNHGKVLVAAISCDILAAVKKRNDGFVRICSAGFPSFEFHIADLEARPGEAGKSVALARGVLRAIVDRGYTVGGFTACTESTVFRGAGVSSSAAFELLVAEIVNALYLNGALDPVEKAIISQYAENVYFGKPCGLLDQSGISLGGINNIDFKDPAKPVIERLTPPAGYTLVITNTGGSHAALTEHYAAIKTEMREVAAFFGKEVLREVDYREFFDAIPALLKKKISERAILRAFHFFEENDRVDAAADALRSGDTAAFLRAVGESGLSSLNCLQNCFVPGSAEQPVTLAIHMSERLIKDGAVRVHGGGFAGTILAYLADAEAGGYAAAMAKVFGRENVFTAQVRLPGAVQLQLHELI